MCTLFPNTKSPHTDKHKRAFQTSTLRAPFSVDAISPQGVLYSSNQARTGVLITNPHFVRTSIVRTELARAKKGKHSSERARERNNSERTEQKLVSKIRMLSVFVLSCSTIVRIVCGMDGCVCCLVG